MTATVTLDEVWRLFKASDEKMARMSEEAARNREEAARDRKETEAALRDLSWRMGRLGNQLGEFAEGMVAPAARRLFTARGIPVHVVARNVEGERDGRAVEIDILVVNGEHVMAIEVKTRPRVEHVDEHLERLAAFKAVFPEYRERVLLGAIAGLTVDDNVARYAYRRGLFVLGQSGETVTILNDEAFQPREW